MPDTHVVGKPFGAFKTGQRVDATGWRNTAALERARNISPLPGMSEETARFCVVLRPFRAGLWNLRAGEIVDTEGLPNVRTLLAVHFLRAATGDELAAAPPPISPEDLTRPRPEGM